MTDLEAKAKDCIENHTHKLVDKPTKQDIYLREESIFIRGYKLGATENGIQWHDLRKDPNDLPKECKWYEVSVYSVLDGKKKKGLYTQRALYDTDREEWETNKFGACERDDWINDMIRAWCEIPQFKE